MIILDTGGLYAALDSNEPLHERCAAALLAGGPVRLLSPFVLAELDYLVGRRIGREGQLAILDEVARGAYALEPFAAEDVRAARAVMARYRDLDLGVTDASLVVLAERHSTLDLLTVDQRHFRTVSGPGGRPFRLLPFDA